MREIAMTLKFAVLGLAAIGAAALASGPALAAMPNGIPQADQIAKAPAAEVDQVRWVCNPWAAAGGAPTIIAPTAITAARASTVRVRGAGIITTTGAAGER
jgi:hypothetical protein